MYLISFSRQLADVQVVCRNGSTRNGGGCPSDVDMQVINLWREREKYISVLNGTK